MKQKFEKTHAFIRSSYRRQENLCIASNQDYAVSFSYTFCDGQLSEFIANVNVWHSGQVFVGVYLGRYGMSCQLEETKSKQIYLLASMKLSYMTLAMLSYLILLKDVRNGREVVRL